MIRAVMFDFGGVIAEEGFWLGLTHIAIQNGKDSDGFFNAAVELIHKPAAMLSECLTRVRGGTNSGN